jgi:hypothetical protein
VGRHWIYYQALRIEEARLLRNDGADIKSVVEFVVWNFLAVLKCQMRMDM